MKITQKQLGDAVAQEILSAKQAEQLVNFIKSDPHSGASFDFTHVLYYFGGMIAIGAMSLFMNLGWEAFGGWGIFFISLLYMAVGLKLTTMFQGKSLFIPAGICGTFSVALTPLAIYGLQQALGYWPEDNNYRNYHRYIEWHWLFMELGTLAVGTILIWKYRYPFLMMPIAVTLWYLTMDLTAMLTGGDYNWELRKIVSLYSGLLMLVIAFWIDIRSRHSGDYAFWLYLFGVIAFWGGLSLMRSDSELNKFIYFLINLLMIGIGVLIVRKVFVIFGALGCCGYFGHLAFDLFENSWLFPIVLSALGLLIIYLGILWQKNEKNITQKAQRYLPEQLQELLKSRKSY